MLVQAISRRDIHPSLKEAILALLWSLSRHLTQVTHTEWWHQTRLQPSWAELTDSA